MEINDKIIYEYCLLRYVPDIERGEFVNVGLLMMSKRWKWLRTAVRINESKIRSLSSLADIDRLMSQIMAFQYAEGTALNLPVEEKYRWMAAVKSAIIQTSPSHPGIICCKMDVAMSKELAGELLDAKFNDLFDRLV